MLSFSDIMQYVNKTIDFIGYLGPQLLLITTLWLLKNKTILLSFYVIGYILNIGLNIVLKGLIQHPRPSEDLKIFNAYIAQGKRIGFDQYGMPSGHAQCVFYSFAFIAVALNDPLISILYLIISLNTGYQRIKYKNHTLIQVICGSIIGALVGYLFYYLSTKKIMGALKYKKDDNAPI